MTRRPADVKALVLTHLAGHLDVPVLPRRPDAPDAPESFVVVIATGGAGASTRALATAQITLDAYAPTEGLAAALALESWQVMRALPSAPGPVARVTATYPAHLPDPSSVAARSTATYTLLTHL